MTQNNRFVIPVLIISAIGIFAVGVAFLVAGIRGRRALPAPTPVIQIPTRATDPAVAAKIGTPTETISSPRGDDGEEVTPTPTIDATPSPSPTTCAPPDGWVSYTVQRGDTLFRIASWADSTVNELTEGNCLLNPDQLEIGQELLVPNEILPTPTPTLTATATLTATVPGTIAAVDATIDTSALTPSATPSATPESASGQPQGIGIALFEITPPDAAPGDEVTISWEVNGEGDAFLNWMADGQIERLSNIGIGTGSQAVTLPMTRQTIKFYLVLQDTAGRTAQQERLYETACSIDYIVDEALMGAAPCPSDDSLTADASYQPFENGYMVWHRIRGGSYRITVFLNDGSVVDTYPDEWDGEDISYADSPPNGLQQPTMGFGRVWIDHEAARDALGWATGPEDSYQALSQQLAGLNGEEEPIGDMLISLPDERVIRYETAGVGRNWVILSESN